VKLSKVTVTGADDSVDHAQLRAISNTYPYVEWGILVSSNGHPHARSRFPSAKWIAKLIDTFKRGDLNLSVHLCGSWVRAVCRGNWDWLVQEGWSIGRLCAMAQRVQLNFHGYKHLVKMQDFAEKLSSMSSNEFILQCDGVNDHLIREVRDIARNTSVLHDRSGGAGVLPGAWPKLIKGVANGYAGGLSAGNVADELRRIEDVVGAETIWIDAETRLREDNDRRLSIPWVCEYLEESAPWVASV